MTTVLDYYLEKYGLKEKKPESKISAHDSLARKRWIDLKKNIRNVSEIVSQFDLKDKNIKHGIEFIRKVECEHNIDQSIFLTGSEVVNFLILDGSNMRYIDTDGRVKNIINYGEISVSFSRLLFADSCNRIIAWTPNCKEFAMLDKEFLVIEALQNLDIREPIYEMIYNKDKEEVISTHIDYLMVWKFRYACKNLVPTTEICLNTNDSSFQPAIFTIERTESKYQRLFVAYKTGIITVMINQGQVISWNKDLHERAITATVFFNPLKYLVTGCVDGSIKIWLAKSDVGDLDLNMVFVGHNGQINCLELFPGGCQATIISSGEDCMLKVWNLEVGDEVESVQLDYPVNCIRSDIGMSTFISTHNQVVDIWRHSHVYSDIISMSVPTVQSSIVFGTDNAILSHCQNGLIYLTDSQSPQTVLARTIIPDTIGKTRVTDSRKIISCFYDYKTYYLFVFLTANRIQVYKGNTDPMLPVNEPMLLDIDSPVSAAVGYVGKVVTGKADSQNKWRSLLFIGTEDGQLRVCEPEVKEKEKILNLPTVQLLSAHEGPICCMLTSKSTGHLFTAASSENSVSAWHVYPFSDEPLSKQITIYCGLLPAHVANIGKYLFTAFRDDESANFPVIVYDIESNRRFDHSPCDDHKEPIISVGACPRMNLFLSASSYCVGTIKVWTRRNVLIRQIEPNLPVYSCLFFTEKADILMGVNKQICCIDHSNFLPKIYLKKQILMKFDEAESDRFHFPNFTALVNKDDSNNRRALDPYFSKQQQNIMFNIKTIFHYHNYVDVLPADEVGEVENRREIFRKSQARQSKIEEDIKSIQKGNHGLNKVKLDKFYAEPTKEEILDKYVSNFINFQPIPLPSDMRTEDETKKVKPLYKVGRYKELSESQGFFPTAKKAETKIIGDQLNVSGYIPNSTIVRLLWPEKMIMDSGTTKKKPLLTSLDKIQQDVARKLAKLKKEEEEMDDDDVKYFDWDDDEDEGKNVSDLFDSKPVKKPEEVKEEINKFELALKQPIVPIEKEEVEKSSVETTPAPKIEKKRPVTTLLTKESIKESFISRTPKTQPELKKVTFSLDDDDDDVVMVSSRVKLKPIEQPPLLEKELSMEIKEPVLDDLSFGMVREKSFFLTESSTDDQVKQPVTLLLPNFLVPFSDDTWFQRLCPPPYTTEDCLKFLPTPLTEDSFVECLLKHVKESCNYTDISGMVNAMHNLYAKDNISKMTLPKVNNLLTEKINEINMFDSEEMIDFFKNSLKLMASMDRIVSDKGLVTICMSRYFEADTCLRAYLKSILCHMGLDETEYALLEKELDGFKLYSVNKGDERIKGIIKLISDWLNKWHQSMATYAEELRVKIAQEVALIGGSQPLSKSTAAALDNVNRIFHIEINSPHDMMYLYPLEKSSKSVLTYINCLNFFLFKNAKKKERSFMKKGGQNKQDSALEGIARKTVVALPKLDPNKQCLVRLGESNADKLNAKKRNTFSISEAMWMKNVQIDRTQHPTHQPYSQYQLSVGGGFVPYLHLIPQPCLINPFPRPEDFDEWKSINDMTSLMSNRSRIFIQQFSLPPEPF